MNRFELRATGGKQAWLFQPDAFFRSLEQFLKLLTCGVTVIHHLLQPVFADPLCEG